MASAEREREREREFGQRVYSARRAGRVIDRVGGRRAAWVHENAAEREGERWDERVKKGRAGESEGYDDC